VKEITTQPIRASFLSVDDSCWYQAVTLTERLNSLRALPSHHILDTTLAERKLNEWKAQSAFSKGIEFAERLATDSLTEDEFLTLLGEPIEAVQQRTPVPEWLKQLDEILAASEDLAENWTGDEAPPKLSLLNVIDIFIKAGVDRLQTALAEFTDEYNNIPFNTATIAGTFVPHLVKPLLTILNRTLVLEMNVARLQERLHGDTPQERFENFIRQARRKSNLVSLFEEYPVMAHQILLVISRWQAYSLEFLRHLCTDWEDICTAFSPLEDPGNLVEVVGGAGDTHRGGRSVLILKFSSGLQLVYKPKSLAVDVHFQDLLIWLNERGFQPAFRTTKLLDCKSYGWSEYITAQSCQTQEGVIRFYERQGGYLALLYELNATDFHYENLIASGEHPMLIDLEALFHSNAMMMGVEQTDVAFDVIHASVMRVGLLPQRIFRSAANQGLDISGLGGREGQKTPRPVLQWENIDTDQMCVVRKHATMGGQQNRPKLGDKEVDLFDHGSAIVAGFTRMFRLLMEQRDAFMAGPLQSFAHDEIRCIMRPTALYGSMLGESFHPDLQRDALDLDRHFDHLWLPTGLFPHFKKLIPFECSDLLVGDIPMFTTRPDTRDIYSSRGECIADYFKQSSFDFVKQTLRDLNENDLKRQVWFIEASIASTLLGKGSSSWKRPSINIPTGKEVTRERLTEAARAVGDHLCDIALRDEQGANWVGLSLLSENEWILTAAMPDLYSGNAGILLFLSYLGAMTGEERYTEIAKAAYRTMCKQIENSKDVITSIGAFDGWGAIIYVLTHLGVLWNDPALFAKAEEFARKIPALIEQDQAFDVLAGSSGCILSLLALYEVAPSPIVLDIAIKCGEHLLANTQQTHSGVAWKSPLSTFEPLAGFSHGVAGQSLSLLRLAALSDDERFRKLALDALAYERSIFSPEEQNWPDFREPDNDEELALQAKEGRKFMATWCHGAPGIGMSRLAALRYIDDEKMREEISIALDTTVKKGFGLNHSLCHGDLGNIEALLLATQILDEPQYHEQLKYFSHLIIESIEIDGWLTGIPRGVESPGLLTGLAGIGYELLRLAKPEHVPSVLVLASPILGNDYA